MEYIKKGNEHIFEFLGNFWRVKEREREIDSFGILYTGYLLSIVKNKREKER